jgi:hypothetical protein
MINTRRRFLAFLFAASAPITFAARLMALQRRQNPPTGPGSDPTKSSDDTMPLKPPTKAILEENDKDIKKSVEKLFQLASDLKAEVEKTDSGKVLSLAMVRKAEEIEKLAKDIKTRAKG